VPPGSEGRLWSARGAGRIGFRRAQGAERPRWRRARRPDGGRCIDAEAGARLVFRKIWVVVCDEEAVGRAATEILVSAEVAAGGINLIYRVHVRVAPTFQVEDTASEGVVRAHHVGDARMCPLCGVDVTLSGDVFDFHTEVCGLFPELGVVEFAAEVSSKDSWVVAEASHGGGEGSELVAGAVFVGDEARVDDGGWRTPKSRPYWEPRILGGRKGPWKSISTVMEVSAGGGVVVGDAAGSLSMVSFDSVLAEASPASSFVVVVVASSAKW